MYYWEYQVVEWLEKRLGKGQEKGRKRWWKLPAGIVILQTFSEGEITSYVQVINHGRDDLWVTKRSGQITHNLGEFIGDLLQVLAERIDS